MKLNRTGKIQMIANAKNWWRRTCIHGNADGHLSFIHCKFN